VKGTENNKHATLLQYRNNYNPEVLDAALYGRLQPIDIKSPK